MDRSGRLQQILIAFLVVLAIVMALVIALLLRDRGAARPDAVAAASPAPSAAAAPDAPDTPLPTVTTAAASVPALPTPTFVPVGGAEAPASAAPPAASAAAAPIRVEGTSVRLEDTDWRGGYRSARGYGGRSATWIYGRGTEYSAMEAVVELEQPASGTAALTIEGMDSEDRAKTTIQIVVNGTEIFSGPNPLPNDDLPLNSGTWASATFRFDAALLQPGANTIRITNLKPGQFSLPPFFMLDYAVLTLPA